MCWYRYFSKVMKSLFIILVVLGASQCSRPEQTKELQNSMPTQKQVNSSMEEINRQFSLDEQVMIAGFVERRGWTMDSTGTGLLYMIYEQGQGDSAKVGMTAEVAYEVSLLDGSVVYSSEEDGPHAFLVGHDNVETGIHEGLQLLRVGDRAKFILPMHLAHGLTGDNNKIPPRSTVVYDIKLLSLK